MIKKIKTPFGLNWKGKTDNMGPTGKDKRKKIGDNRRVFPFLEWSHEEMNHTVKREIT